MNENVPNVSEIEDTGLHDGVTLMLFTPNPHFINTPIWNAIMNQIYHRLMVQCHHHTAHKFQHLLHPLLFQ